MFLDNYDVHNRTLESQDNIDMHVDTCVQADIRVQTRADIGTYIRTSMRTHVRSRVCAHA